MEPRIRAEKIRQVIIGDEIRVLIVKPPLTGIVSSYDLELVKGAIVRITDRLGNPTGTGLIIDPDYGYIVTVHHVIYLLDEIWIEHQRRKVQVEYCGDYSAPDRDIAVLKCNPKELSEGITRVPLMEPRNEDFGSEVYVWGFPADERKEYYPDLFHVAGKLRPAHLLTPEHGNMESSLRALSARKPWNVPYYTGNPLNVYYIENRTVPAGMSGSPVALRGAVIGFVHGDSRQHVDYEGYIEGDQRVFVIRWSDIKDLLPINYNRAAVHKIQQFGKSRKRKEDDGL